MPRWDRVMASGGVVALLLVLGGPLHAQDPALRPSSAAVDVGSDVLVAQVTVDGEPLFTLRGGSALPAEVRAARAAAAIRAAARDRTVDPATVTAVEDGTLTYIMAGDTRLLALVDADARLEDVTRQELAVAVTERVRSAITAYRADREPEALVEAGLQAVIATTVLALVALAVWRLWRWLDRRLAEAIERRLRSLGVEAVHAGGSAKAGEVARGTLRLFRSLLLAAAVLTYLQLVLGLFPWTRPIHARLWEWVVGPLEAMGRELLAQTPNLIFLVILAVVVRWLIRLIRLFFDAIERRSVSLGGFEPEWARPTYKIVRLVTIAFAIVVAYPYIPGSSTAAFKGVSIFAGVVLSLGSSSIISNLVAGFTMTYRRTFRVGDRVRIGDVVGDVLDVRLQVTHLRTPKNEEVVVPNSVILGSPVTNFSSLARTWGLILHTTVGIGYETPWRQVEAMLLLAAERTPGMLREPAPFVLQRALGDFCVTYELNAFCDRPDQMAFLYADLHRSILDVFNEYGVQIMTPAYEGDPEQPKLVPREQWFAAPAAAGTPVRGPDRPTGVSVI